MKTSINKINSKQIGMTITFTGEITKVNPKKIKAEETTFECRSCRKLHIVKQKDLQIYEPVMCIDCGGKSFKMLPEKSNYSDYQQITVKDTNNYVDKYNREREASTISCIIPHNYVNQHITKDKVQITGTLKLKKIENLYVEASEIELIQEKE